MPSPSSPSAPELTPHPPLREYYPGAQERRGFVVGLFDRTAPHYDRIDRVMSLGSGVRYRRDALRRAGLTGGMAVLDVAVGTGLVARAALAIVGSSGRVTGLDASAGMLEQARASVRGPFVQGLAEKLPFADGAVDFLTMGYALRHVSDLQTTFAEYRRVLRPGGTLLVLELTPPPRDTVRYALARIYLQRILPALARLGPGGREAHTLMRYFWDTVESCVPPQTILDALANAGFAEPVRRRTYVLFSEYVATRSR